MRHIAKIEGGKVAATTLADFLVEKLEARVAGTDVRDGFYNVQTGSWFGRASVTLGRRIANPAKHLAKLRASGEGRTNATTGSPGVSGYQQRADASSAAGYRARERSRELAAWLAQQI